MYKLCLYVPASHLDAVKQALFAAGAGRIGDYDSCCWQVAGQGQFCPLTGSNPYIGEQDQIETVEEYKVELVCSDDVIAMAVAALKQAHPYEEPAYQVWRLEDF
ncbi:MAG TPA: YqfO family protein [Spongiibacteraceae bacterium]|jgi:hypothetical protein